MDVIVIGCGASGVAAIRKLHDAGLKVIGLEAADRIGGRIHSVPFGDGIIDLGAAWCHGEKNNIVYEIAEPLGLLGKPGNQINVYVLSNGECAPDNISNRILGEIDKEVKTADKDNTRSVLECVQNALTTNEVIKSQPELAKCIAEYYTRMQHLGGFEDPKNDKSLMGLTKGHTCEGEFMLNWKGRGYKSILNVLLNKYPDPVKEIPVQILLNKEVETIKWGTSQAENASSPLVQVRCKDGSLYTAKSVIVTLSVPVLKERHTELFNPPLPQDKVTCINSLHYCILDKIYIEFTKPWWPTTHAKFTILWREEDLANFAGEEEWITHIFGLETIEHQPNVLLAWLFGKGAKMMENVSSENVKAGVNKFLEKVLMKKFDVAPVKSIIRSQWASNPLARCAYAYRSVASEENGASAELLSKPLLNGSFPVVCFAGEATSYKYHTAVHGAIDAGFREAQRLIDIIKKD